MANDSVIGALRAVLGMDTADFDLAVDRSKKKAGELDQAVSNVGKSSGLATLVNVASGVFAGLQIAQTVKDISDFNDRIVKQTAAFRDLADRVNLTTDAYQAVRLAAIGVGTSQAAMDTSLLRLNQEIGAAVEGNKRAIDVFKLLGVNLLDSNGKTKDFSGNLQLVALALDRMTDSSLKARIEQQVFGQSGRSVDSMVRQLAQGVDVLQEKFKNSIVSAETIDGLKKLEDEAASNNAKFEAFYATVAGPVYLSAMNSIADASANVAKSIEASRDGWQAFLKELAGPANVKPMGVDPKDLKDANTEVYDLTQKIAGYQALLADPRYSEARKKQIQAEIDKLREQLSVLQDIGRQQAKNSADSISPGYDQSEIDARRGSRDVDPNLGAGRSPTARGGSTKTATDRIGDMIAKLKEQTKAAKDALAGMIAGADKGLPIKDVEDAVALQKKIADAIAELHRGGISQNDPRIQQVKDLIIAENNAEAALRKRKEAEQDATAAEKQYGDGTVDYTDKVNRLWDALNTGRLSTDAFTEAMKQAGYALDDQKAKAEGAKGGIDGFIAGFENAAAKASRSETSFGDGAKAFDLVKDGITDVVDSFVSLDGNVGQTLDNVLKKISQFAFNVLVLKPLFDSIETMIKGATTGTTTGGGGIFSLIGSLLGSGGGYVPAVSATTNTIPDIGTLIPTLGLAGGGDAPVGVPYLVGEKGPELRIDDVPGRIVPHDQSMQMLRRLAAGAPMASAGSAPVTSQEFGDGQGGATIVQNINVLPDINSAIKRQIRDNLPLFAEAGAQRTETKRRQGGRIKANFLGR